MIDRPNNQGTDRPGLREVSLSIKGACFIIISISEMVSDLVLEICTTFIGSVSSHMNPHARLLVSR